jgi:hypothetical protein
VKITTMTMKSVAAVTMATIGIASAPVASAYPIAGKLGSQLTIVDSVGQVTVNAVSGPVTPAISQFNAIVPNQAIYRVLWQTASPTNISGATIPQGAQSTGKIHFDVTGPPPTTVTMNNGMEDLLIWGS